MKKRVVLLISILMMASLMTFSALADCWTWTIEDNGYVILKSHTPMDTTQVIIPDRYYPDESIKNAIIDALKAQTLLGVPGLMPLVRMLESGLGLPVMAIGEHAFENYPNLTYVYIPETIQSIGAFAFWGCCNLTGITIPSSVTNIGDNCFGGCRDDVVISAAPGSAASQYAFDYGLPLEAIRSQNADAVPDLIVGYLSNVTAIEGLRVGQSISFDASIQNINAVSTETGFNIKWFVNGVEMGYGYHEAIPGNMEVFEGNSSFSFSPESAGTYSVVFQVDCDDHIPESNEANNEMTILVHVTQ